MRYASGSNVLAVSTYVVGSEGLTSYWHRFHHFGHQELDPVLAPWNWVMPGVFALLLGFACAGYIRSQSWRDYWPILVSPFVVVLVNDLIVYGTLRGLVADGVATIILVIGGCIVAAFFGLVGVGLYKAIVLRKNSVQG